MSPRLHCSPAPAVLLAIWLAATALWPSTLVAQTLSEAQVKAAFLLNFPKFVEWPADTFSAADAPLLIGILGDDPFGNFLNEAARGKSVEGHRLVMKRLKSADDWSQVHVLYISSSESDLLQQILQRVGRSRVLLVSDIDRFCQSGGTVGFITDSHRIQFEVNLGNARRQELKISSKLLSLASKVHER